MFGFIGAIPDFTLKIYKELLTTIFDFGYSINSLKNYLLDNNPKEPF